MLRGKKVGGWGVVCLRLRVASHTLLRTGCIQKGALFTTINYQKTNKGHYKNAQNILIVTRLNMGHGYAAMLKSEASSCDGARCPKCLGGIFLHRNLEPSVLPSFFLTLCLSFPNMIYLQIIQEHHIEGSLFISFNFDYILNPILSPFPVLSVILPTKYLHE